MGPQGNFMLNLETTNGGNSDQGIKKEMKGTNLIAKNFYTKISSEKLPSS